ncbi:MAG TPA: prolyl oligopeptidase family serine peptidase [Phnomibacter sp.]|nr:prolyl oligopeptidase family serine peptidase [Phnomibacter sp.]
MKKNLLMLCLVALGLGSSAQDDIQYQRPPKAIVDILLAPGTPTVSIDDKGVNMILSERTSYPSIEELAQPELRIAGMRLNPNNFGPSRAGYVTNFKIKNVATGKELQVTGLPANMKAGNAVWNPSQTKFAFSNTSANGIDLYEADIKTGAAKKVNKRFLNMILADYGYIDDATLVYNVTLQPATKAPPKPLAPKGPVVQQNLGKAAPSRTYQDLIKNPYDEQLFEFYATSQLVENKAGLETAIGTPAIYSRASVSPDKKYYLIETIKKPFSYLVQVNGFPSTMKITDRKGTLVKLLAELPSSESSPTGFDNVQDVPRGYNWRADEAATVYWAKPLDGGIMKTNTPFHDAVYTLQAPFTGAEKELVKTEMRFRGITWGDANLAMMAEGLQGKQRAKAWKLNPSTGATEVLFDRSTNDRYNDPGAPVTHRNSYGRAVLQTVNNGTAIPMIGAGASPDGDLPFYALFDLNTKKQSILWRCEKGYFETVSDVLDAEKGLIITSRQSQTEAPNFYVRDVKANSSKAITTFPDPQPALRQISKQKITYKRKDGIDLTATVYLPAGYDAKKDGRLPIVMWAYPREFKSASDAAQVRGSKFTFTRLNYGSPIFYATQGYAVMDEAEFPIVGEGDKQPNDNFVDQLIWNAEAGLKAAYDLGFGDTSRAAVGGHSYGAFMTANLLSHSRLFKAGIARSGAYMRTLTPFGFQNEERTYWQAPDLYYKMSPFSYADKVKDALLLIHGDADNNPGTFPINSERLFNAIKGHGGTVRFVSLPYESHGYAAQENLLHLLWEQYTWLEKYVKGAGK